jgi:hypothetical protein
MRRDRAQYGQAMTEFLVACLVLIPLFLAMPLLGKYLDMAHAGVQGSRYLAWERTVWAPSDKDDLQLAHEMRNRVYTAVGTPVLPVDGAGPPAAYNPLWHDPAGAPMLASFDKVGAAMAEEQTTPGLITNALVQGVLNAYNTILGWLSEFNGAPEVHFDNVNVKRMYAGGSVVAIAEQGAASTGSGQNPQAALAYELPSNLYVPAVGMASRPNVIITDAWGVTGAGRRKDCPGRSELCQVESLVPTYLTLGGWVQDVTNAFGKVIPEFGKLEFGLVKPGLAPADRNEKAK